MSSDGLTFRRTCAVLMSFLLRVPASRPFLLAILIIGVCAPAAAATAVQAEPAAQSGPGRVVVTVSLEGVRIPAVNVALRSVDGNIVIGRSTTDTIGQVTFPDVAAGRYAVLATREGFADSESAQFTVREGATEQVLVEMRLTFVRESIDVVVPANSPTESMQPVAVSDLLTGTKMDIQPLAGDDFQSLLTVLPSIIRGPEGRLRIKGGAPTTGALQMSSASLNDPSTGDFDLELPSGAVESVEVLSNPFAAEYGRFSTSVTQVRTKRGTNEWVIKPTNLTARLREGLRVREQVRAAPLDLRPDQARPAAVRRVRAVSIRPDAGQEPAGRTARSASTASIRSRGSTRCSRRAMP